MGCMYCEANEFRDSLMEELCVLPWATVYLMRDQRYYGRCVVAFRGHHADELYQLTDEELHGYMASVARSAQAIQEVSGAQKINYAIYGDKASHVHVHVVPKRPDWDDWGGPFQMGGEPVFLPAEAWEELKSKLLALLS